MGSISHLYGALSRQYRCGYGDWLFLLHAGSGVNLYAGCYWYSSRPLDSGTEDAWHLSSRGGSVYDSHCMVWSHGRGWGGFCHHLLALFLVGGFLYAYHSIVQFGGIHGIASGRYG